MIRASALSLDRAGGSLRLAMGHVTFTLNARTYRFRCGDGEEQRLLELAADLQQRIERLASEFGQVGDERLLVMAALLATDELLDLRSKSAERQAGDLIAPTPGAAQPPIAPQPVEARSLPEIEAPQMQPVAAVRDLPPPEPASRGATQGNARRPVARASLNERLAEARDAPPIERKTGNA